MRNYVYISYTGRRQFDCENWTKLMQILKGIDTNWCERRLTSKLNFICFEEYDFIIVML
jgi:hypothetical protein